MLGYSMKEETKIVDPRKKKFTVADNEVFRVEIMREIHALRKEVAELKEKLDQKADKPADPEEDSDYWEDVDEVIDFAESLGVNLKDIALRAEDRE